MGFRRMAINLGMDKPMKPDKDADYSMGIFSIIILNYFIYGLNQAVGTVIWILIAIAIISSILNQINTQDSVGFFLNVMVYSIFNLFVYVLNRDLSIIIYMLLLLSTIGFILKGKMQNKKNTAPD